MTRTLLYYPHINISNMNWIKQAVLYWDRVGTIVPREIWPVFRDVPALHMLEEQDLLRTYHPEEYVHAGDQLAEEFIQIQSSRRFQFLKQQYGGRGRKYSIYPGKMSQDLYDYVLQHQIAEEDPLEHTLEFHHFDGLLYMSLLAKYLADQDWEEATTPGTDYGLYQRLALGSELGLVEIPAISVTLSNVLPMPTQESSLESILQFRTEQRQSLLRFRAVITEYQDQLANARSNGEIQQITEGFQEAIEANVSEIEEALEDLRIATKLGTINSTVLASLEFAEAGVDGITNPITPARQIVGRGIEVKHANVLAQNAERQVLRRNAFSYLYLGRRAGIFNRIGKR